MPCYHPINLKRSKEKYGSLTVPCGQCIGCRLEKSRQWAVRCVHEAQMHQENCFITLTYDDEHLIWGKQAPTLVPKDLQLFWKRFRKEHGNGIRYYACGEYGERTSRPHYHACVFGFDFQDQKLFDSSNGNDLYTSDNLNTLWGHGNSIIGKLTFESAAYVARYVTTKLTGPYAKVYTELGIEPEFARMSRRPGIGSTWFQRYVTDVYPSDALLVRGKKCRPPRFYDNKYELQNMEVFEGIKNSRKLKADKKYWKDSDKGAPKLKDMEVVKQSQIKSLNRVKI